MTVDIQLMREAVTVVSFLAFIGIVAWAYSDRNGKRFDEAARLPLEDDSEVLEGERVPNQISGAKT